MHPKIEAEARKMSSVPGYMRQEYGKVIDFDGNLVPFEQLPAQAALSRAMKVHNRGYLIKGRKMGSTTNIAWEFFEDAVWTPNLRVLVAAHRDSSAKEIFRIYKEFYKNLPKWFKEQVPGMKARVSADHIEFEHGSRIVCTTADSDAARGSTWQRVHLSEYCWYRDIERTAGAIMGSVPLTATVWRESTANGLNHGHRAWQSDDEYHKLFLGWMTDPRYQSKTPPKGGIPQYWNEYAEEHNLTKGQLWWAVKVWRNQMHSNTRLFHQEFPATADLAFTTSGDRYFDTFFDGSHIDHTNVHDMVGIRSYGESQPFRLYSMGIDSAGGSKVGDFSCWYICDVTDSDAPICVSAFMGRYKPREFAKLAYEECKKYQALAVIEVNDGYGTAVLDYFLEMGYPLIYRRRVFDKLASKWTEALGWKTLKQTRSVMLARLHEAIEGGTHVVTDTRLQAMINTFVYIDGKAQADSGEHDDMVMAAAMALMGIEQCVEVKEQKKRRRPNSVEEILHWEMLHGRRFSNSSDDFDDDARSILVGNSENDVLRELNTP